MNLSSCDIGNPIYRLATKQFETLSGTFTATIYLDGDSPVEVKAKYTAHETPDGYDVDVEGHFPESENIDEDIYASLERELSARINHVTF